ncbi:MAG: ribokinase [Synergistaceae bacterium]|nr:ribokinase [Synergistaceae bacterium]MBR0094737.1 ribokinase [Synergistaceae bacterium]
MSAVAVVGSLNIDLVIRAPHCPKKGETVIGGPFGMAGGGKGSNQALGVARLNARSHMIGCVGNDDFGKKLRAVLVENGVDCSHLQTRKELATGTAVITVTDEGENSIVVAQGANSLLDEKAILDAKKIFESSDSALFQMESPTDTVAAGLKLARQTGCKTFLSAEPPFSLPSDSWRNIDYLILNEKALSFYATNKHKNNLDLMARDVLDRGVRCLVVTQSARGGMVFEAEGDSFSFEAFNIRSVDHTGARDAFCAGFCVALGEGRPIRRAARFGSACGALACTKIGAHPSLPWRHQVGALLGEASGDDYEQ